MVSYIQIFALGCFLVLTLVRTASSDENLTEGCTSWPPGLKSLAECCEVPVHNNKDVENTCESYCTSKKNYSDDCVLDCYVRRTNILKRKGKINVAAIASLYYTSDFTGHWIEAVGRGVASCHYESNGALKENLAKYFNCIDDFLSENCIWFKKDDGCYEVFNHFKNCTSPPIDCSQKTAKYANDCCKKPQVLTGISLSCNLECAKKEFLNPEQSICALLCHSMETGLLTSDGNINFDKAIENLQSSREYSDKWVQPVGDAVEFCKAEMKGLNNITAVSELGNCFDRYLENNCVEFVHRFNCYDQARFTLKCPNVGMY